jgi:hypothetical protein
MPLIERRTSAKIAWIRLLGKRIIDKSEKVRDDDYWKTGVETRFSTNEGGKVIAFKRQVP